MMLRQKSSVNVTTSTAKICLEKKKANIRHAIGFHVEGLQPRQHAAIHAVITSDEEEKWESFAEFEADASGSIFPALQKPLRATYHEVDPTGLYWSMQPQVKQRIPRFFHKLSLKPIDMEFSLKIGGQTLAGETLHRYVQAPDVAREEVDAEFRGVLFTNKSKPCKGALIVLGGSGGGKAEVEAAILADEGFTTLSLAYFAEPGLPKECFEIPLEYFEKPIQWLMRRSAQPGVGIVGWSAGAQLALLIASHYPQIKKAVSFVGLPVVTVGYGVTIQQRAAWGLNGKGLPFIPIRLDKIDMTPPIAGVNGYLAALEDGAAVKMAEIPVEKIQGPVLLISGQDDRTWPSYQTSERAFKRLQAAKRPYKDLHLAFKDAGHNIIAPNLPTSVHYALHRVIQMVIDFGGEPAADAYATREAWEKMLEFLAEG